VTTLGERSGHIPANLLDIFHYQHGVPGFCGHNFYELSPRRFLLGRFSTIKQKKQYVTAH
jgi:hypothetical protein